MSRPLAVVILAAGEGTRMKSRMPKVLHSIAGLSLLEHVLKTALALKASRVAVVVGPDSNAVSERVQKVMPQAQVFVQRERRGTAHALLQARSLFDDKTHDVLVLFGDTPLVTPHTLTQLISSLTSHAVAVLGFQAANPSGYGRLVQNGDALQAIVEEKDASDAQRSIRFVNGGVMALAAPSADMLVSMIDDKNAKQEFYLTDAVHLAVNKGLKAFALETTEDEVRGVNTRVQLAEAEAVFQNRARIHAMQLGVTLNAPETVMFSHDTLLEPDVVIAPHVVFGVGVVVKTGAEIRSFSHLEGCVVDAHATVGPFARLRPGTEVGQGAHVGNFVELKNTTLAKGAKANHLSYLGDSVVGEAANIGAGTITCNYDGFGKYQTTIGAGAFVGSNSALVAPVTIGDGAYVGSGSVITRDVPNDALSIARGQQVDKLGWAATFREANAYKRKK